MYDAHFCFPLPSMLKVQIFHPMYIWGRITAKVPLSAEKYVDFRELNLHQGLIFQEMLQHGSFSLSLLWQLF